MWWPSLRPTPVGCWLTSIWEAGLGQEGRRDDVRPMRTVVSRLRRKLGDDADNPTFIFTETGMGYWMPTGEMRGEGSDALGLQRHRGPGIWPQCENDTPGLT